MPDPFPSSSLPPTQNPAQPNLAPPPPPLPAQPVTSPLVAPAADLSQPMPPPPPAPSSPAVHLPVPESPLDDVPDEEEDLSALSPFVIMKKKTAQGLFQSAPPAAVQSPLQPVQATSITSTPSMSAPAGFAPDPQPIVEVGRDLATPQDAPFILPINPPLAPSVPPVPVLAVPEPIPVATPVSAPASLPPVQPLGLVNKAVPLMASTPVPGAAKVPPTLTEPVRLQGSSGSKIGLIALVGLFIAIIALGGGGVALAAQGIRIPLLYPLVTGLSTNGVTVSKKAASLLKSHSSYQFNGEMFVKLNNAESKPGLPASSTASTTKDSLSTIHVTVETGEPLQYSQQEKNLIGKIDLAVGDNSDIPVYLNAGADAEWLFDLPATTDATLVKTDSTQLYKTLLYPALHPLPLGALLAAIQQESSYKKVEAKSLARHSYFLNGSLLKDYLPEGSEVKVANLDVDYTWKTAQPMRAAFAGMFSYQGTDYQISETWNYAVWDTDLNSSSSDMAKVVDTTSPDQATSVTIAKFVSDIGVTSLSTVPNTVSEAASDDTTPITPSGEGVTTITTAITSVPPVPISPASSDAQKRDSQRLSDLGDLQKALEKYKSKEGSYPKSTGLEQTRSSTVLLSALVPTYLTKLPVDPLKDTYWYEYQSDGTMYTLRSVAEDATNVKALKGKAFAYFQVNKQ